MEKVERINPYYHLFVAVEGALHHGTETSLEKLNIDSIRLLKSESSHQVPAKQQLKICN